MVTFGACTSAWTSSTGGEGGASPSIGTLMTAPQSGQLNSWPPADESTSTFCPHEHESLISIMREYRRFTGWRNEFGTHRTLQRSSIAGSEAAFSSRSIAGVQLHGTKPKPNMSTWINHVVWRGKDLAGFEIEESCLVMTRQIRWLWPRSRTTVLPGDNCNSVLGFIVWWNSSDPADASTGA